MLKKVKRQIQTAGKNWFAITALILAGFLSASATHAAQTLALGWDASTNANVAGYTLYYGTNSGNYSFKVDAGTNIATTVAQLNAGGTYYFAVTAYDSDGVESSPSPEVSFIIPGLMQITGGNAAEGVAASLSFVVIPDKSYEIQASDDLRAWTTIAVTDVQTTNAWYQFQDTPSEGIHSQRFYRYIQHDNPAHQ